ncbi:MAG TPA: NAD-dependent epimerase/dehydratase family protein, partial [Verrucomicrobiae bacterium]
EPGRGFHSGGSFPMRQNPGELETDALGRLRGWRRIHLVDASVLPDIPATQITFSVMANAHRIGSAPEPAESTGVESSCLGGAKAPGVCAITGSNGYVGGAIKNYFLTQGWDVLDLVRQPKAGARTARFQLGADVPADSLAGVDVLVHCAYDFKPLQWEELRAVNVAGTEKLFRAARTAGVKKIICISTISAYEGCRSLYGRAKLEIEKLALDHGALVIRPGLVYGRGPGGMFGKLAQQVRKSSVIPLIGDGSQIQYLVHEEDLSRFIWRYAAGEIQCGPRILTAANAEPWPFKKLLREIARGQNRKPAFIPLPWRLVWLGLRSAEACSLRLNFRSDSLVSLMYQNPNPDFSPNAAAGLVCRSFSSENVP